MNNANTSKDAKKQVPIRMTPKEHALAIELARAEGRSVANFVLRMYMLGLHTHQRQRASSSSQA